MYWYEFEKGMNDSFAEPSRPRLTWKAPARNEQALEQKAGSG
jgi:hypothetical protein